VLPSPRCLPPGSHEGYQFWQIKLQLEILSFLRLKTLPKMKGIPLYTEINDLHKLTGSKIRTGNPLFHCFDMATTNDLATTSLPPHRTDFYTLALNFGTRNLDFTLNDNIFRHPNHFVLCVAPGQVAKWEKNGDWFGYCTFFKNGFLNFNSEVNFLQQYPFFNISETNLLPVNDVHFKILSVYFQQIISEQAASSAFSIEIMQSAFQAVLWQVRRIYEEEKKVNPLQKANAVIAAQFQYLVNENFLKKISVEEYAQLLNISANHLSQTITETTGTTAKRFITKRRLEEAKYLLSYTTDSISEISFHLNFSEPTHFTKSFKKETGKTPQEFRSSTF
jgi:AraC family transcriptional regulator, transcriptional activator of pobA